MIIKEYKVIQGIEPKDLERVLNNNALDRWELAYMYEEDEHNWSTFGFILERTKLIIRERL